MEELRHEVGNVVKEEKVLENPENSNQDKHHPEEEWSIIKRFL